MANRATAQLKKKAPHLGTLSFTANQYYCLAHEYIIVDSVLMNSFPYS